MERNIFDDLEIDFSNFKDDPKTLIRDVVRKSEELRATFTNNATNEVLLTMAKDHAKIDLEAKRQYDSDFPLYDTEQMTDAGLYHAINALREYANELEKEFKYRVAMKNKDTEYDRKVAHLQYNRLREAYTALVNFWKAFAPEVGPFPFIKAASGNYTRASVTGPVYRFVSPTGDDYFNPFTAARKIGIEIVTLMDLVEYLDENTDSGWTYTTTND